MDASTGARDASTGPRVDASTGTAPVDAGSGTTTGVDAGSACVNALPAGWSLAAFNTGIDPCPAAYTEHVVFGSPTIGAGACSCACSVTKAGSCGQGTLAMNTNPGHHVDTCTVAWFTATVNDTQCIAVPADQQAALGNFEATPLPASGLGGTCTETAATNAGLLSEPTERFCEVPTASANAVCNGTAPTGFSACIIASGNVACPSTTPFIHPFTVEESATLACGSCSTCSVSTTCTNPTISAFVDANCTAPAALTFAVDGTCVTNPAEQTVQSIQYNATASNACTPGTSTGTAQLVGASTICCR